MIRIWETDICDTITSRHLVGRWSRDYHMCRLVFLCFFPRPRCFQIRGKRRYLSSNISPTENNDNTHIREAWTAIDRIFFQANGMSARLHDWNTKSLSKCFVKKLDGNYRKIRQAVLNKSWKQHPTKQPLYSHLPSISQTIPTKTNKTCRTEL